MNFFEKFTGGGAKDSEEKFKEEKFQRRQDENKTEMKEAKKMAKEARIKKAQELGTEGPLGAFKDHKGMGPSKKITDKENEYNDPRADEELLGGQDYPGDFEDRQKLGGKFVESEDLEDEGSVSSIENQADEAVMERYQEYLDIKEKLGDVYDFGALIDKVFKTMDKNLDNKSAEEKQKELDIFFDKVNAFTVKYKEILTQELPEAEEEIEVKKAFKENIGDLYYSGNEVEAKPKFKGMKVKDAKPKTVLRHRKNKKSKVVKKPSVITEDDDVGGLRAYNPRTGKMEKL